ncbi:unnamed protein product [Closterium sp. NIES-54]
MDVWGPARVIGQGRERYFLLVVDDYMRYTIVFPLRSKGEVPDVLIPWIRAVCLQLREREDILQLFTLLASPQQNGIAERRIGLVMEVAHTSMIHAAAPHFLWPFADVTFDESFPFYRLFPYRSAPLPPPPLFLAPGPPLVDPLPPQGPAPSGVSQVDPLPGTVPVEVAVDSGAARGAVSGGVEPAGAEPGGAEPAGAESEGAGFVGTEPGGAEPGGTEPAGAEPGGAESEGAEFEGAEPGGSLSPGGPPTAGVYGAAGPGGARTGGTGAVGAGGAAGVGAGGTGAGTAGVTRGIGAGGNRVPLPSPPASSLADGPDPESDLARVASPTVPRPLASVVTDPSFESTAASALVTELVYFAALCRLDYATALVAESDLPVLRSLGTAMDTEMASWKSTGTYVDAVPPSGANIVGWHVDFRAQNDYELHSVDFSTDFLQGSLHEEIWLRRPAGFTGSFPAGTQWSLRRPVYGLLQPPREWHDTLRTTLAALGFAPSTAELLLFLRTDTSVPPFYVLVYVNDLIFATADTKALALVLQRFGFRYSLPQSTPLPTGHLLSAPPLDEFVEPSGPYPELVGCLMYLMTCTRPDLAYPLSILARYVAPGRHRPEYWEAAKRVLRYLCSTSGMGLVLGGRSPVVPTGHADASWVDNKAMIALCQEHRLEHITKHIALRYFLARELQQRGQLRLAYVATRANTADIFTKALQPCDHQHFCTVLGLVLTLPHLLIA